LSPWQGEVPVYDVMSNVAKNGVKASPPRPPRRAPHSVSRQSFCAGGEEGERGRGGALSRSRTSAGCCAQRQRA